MTHTTVTRAGAVVCLMFFALTGCVPQATAPRQVSSPALATTTTLTPQAAEAAIQQRLASLGFGVAVDPGGIIRAEIATGAPPEWLACERVLVENNDGIVRRTHWASPETRRIWLEVRIAEVAGRTNVTLSPYYEGMPRPLQFRRVPRGMRQLGPARAHAAGRGGRRVRAALPHGER